VFVVRPFPRIYDRLRPPADAVLLQNRRLDALLLAQIIRELAKADSDLNWINVDCVTGHGTAASNSLCVPVAPPRPSPSTSCC